MEKSLEKRKVKVTRLKESERDLGEKIRMQDSIIRELQEEAEVAFLLLTLPPTSSCSLQFFVYGKVV